MAPKKSKKPHKRVSPKRYEMVTFTSSIYDGEFTFPAQKHLTQKMSIELNDGNPSVLRDWLVASGADENDIEAFLELDGDETRQFMQEWGAGQLATLPKSSE